MGDKAGSFKDIRFFGWVWIVPIFNWIKEMLELDLSSNKLKISSIQLYLSSNELKIGTIQLYLSSNELKISLT